MAVTLFCRLSHLLFPLCTISLSWHDESVRFSRARRRYCLLISSSWVRHSCTWRWKACNTKHRNQLAKENLKTEDCPLIWTINTYLLPCTDERIWGTIINNEPFDVKKWKLNKSNKWNKLTTHSDRNIIDLNTPTDSTLSDSRNVHVHVDWL